MAYLPKGIRIKAMGVVDNQLQCRIYIDFPLWFASMYGWSVDDFWRFGAIGAFI